MKPSTQPLEQSLGMQYYATDTQGIGGILRSTPQDFIVEELPVKFTGTGPYLIAKLTKTSWEHQHAMREIAKRLAISPPRKTLPQRHHPRTRHSSPVQPRPRKP